MSLTVGARVGPYEVLAAIGAGGMGEVYKARDTRIDRSVAIKILPGGFAADAAARERFDREARAISQLDHPHICALYDLGTHEGTAYLVMQFVEGETLSRRLERGPLPLDDVRALALQLADAIEVAHERGIVHRDLKPANVMVTPAGDVKVLDFGLAKDHSVPANLSSSPTVLDATGAGFILGTAAYMSPEQARGKPVDKRADVWAFGCVLYEMLTGKQAFRGETVTDVLAAVIHKDPDWSAIPSTAPAHVVQVARRCLQKDARQRMRDIGDARIGLESSEGANPPNLADAARARATDGPRSRLVPWAVVAALAIVTTALGIAAWQTAGGGATAEAPVVRLSMNLQYVMHLGYPQPSLAFSPDGTKIVYTGFRPQGGIGVWLRALDQPEPTLIAGASGRNAFFSPDGRSVATTVEEGVRKLSLASGTSTLVSAIPNAAFGGTWTVRDEIVFAVPETGLWRVPAAGGTPQRIAQGRFWYPDALPDGRHVVVTLDNPAARTSDDFRIALVNIDSGEVRTLVEGGTYVRYAVSGHLVYLRNGSLLAVPFDASRLAVGGAPVAVVSGVFMNPSISSGNFAISPTGSLAYAAGDGSEFRRTLVALNPDGTKRLLTDDRRNYANPRVSPDGTRIAVTADAVRGAALVLDIARGVLSRITPDDHDATRPIWTPDGRSLVVAASKEDELRGLFLVRAEAGAPMERLTSSEYSQIPHSWTPDGKTLVFSETRPTTAADLWTLTLDGDRTPRPLLQTRDAEQEAAVSPDGRSIAYESNRSGRTVVYVADFPALTNTVQISAGDARLPVWSRDGRRLFFKETGFAIHAVDISGVGRQTALIVSKPQRIVQVPASPRGPYDVTPDGRFVVVDGEAVAGAVSELKIVLNWFTELRAKLPAR